MTKKFTRWDAADYLVSEEDVALYLNICMQEDPGDGSLIRAALDDIERARKTATSEASAHLKPWSVPG